MNKGRMTIRIGDEERIEMRPPHPNLHLPLVEDFVDAVREDRTPVVDGEVGYQVQSLVDEIYGFES